LLRLTYQSISWHGGMEQVPRRSRPRSRPQWGTLRGLLRFHCETIRLETKERVYAWYSPLVDRNSDPHHHSLVAVRRAPLVAPQADLTVINGRTVGRLIGCLSRRQPAWHYLLASVQRLERLASLESSVVAPSLPCAHPHPADGHAKLMQFVWRGNPEPRGRERSVYP
jgi:hypothetical protein